MRRPTLSPEQYRRITVAAAILLALIIVTGAAVRLTGSGLGCPDWPNCTTGNLAPTAEVGAHGWIEFVNRLVTGLVSIVVIVAVLGALVRTPRRRDLTWLSVGLVVGVIAQALLGGLVVKKLLDPPFVMGHFLLSAVLLADALVLVWRAGVPDGTPTPVVVPRLVHRLAIVVVALACAVLVTGTVVTGAGPHSGDAGNSAKVSLRATRLDLAIPSVARVHGTTVMIFLGAVVLLLVVLVRTRASRLVYRRVGLLLGLLVAQAAVGYLQYFNGLPAALVGIHVAGATAVFSAAVGVLLGCRTPDRAPVPVRARRRAGGARRLTWRRARLTARSGRGLYRPSGSMVIHMGRWSRSDAGDRHNLTLRAQSLRRRRRSDSRCRHVPSCRAVAARRWSPCSSRAAPRWSRSLPARAATGPSAEQLEAVAEQYNLARVEVDRASKLIEDTNRQIQLAETRVATVRDRIRGRAAALYRRSSAGSPLPITDSATYTEQVRHRKYLEAAELPDQELADTLDGELRHLRAEEESQRQARTMRQRDLDNATRLKRRLATLAREAAASHSLGTGDGAGPMATATATGARPGSTAVAPSTPTHPPTGAPTPTTRPVTSIPSPSSPPPGNAPPASARAAIAIAYARAQLGKPYVFAAAGPDTFDCSGLTMAAWAAAGVRMPHYSGSQANMFPKVTWQQLQPGDIVVFYDDLHHVGLYIGGGMMIHAPQTGDVVKIAPAWRTTFQWGVRPG